MDHVAGLQGGRHLGAAVHNVMTDDPGYTGESLLAAHAASIPNLPK